MRVLIVENSTIIAMHLAKLVTDLGHEVCARAASASDAIAQAAALKPDVAIMDLRLAKGSSGVDAARFCASTWSPSSRQRFDASPTLTPMTAPSSDTLSGRPAASIPAQFVGRPERLTAPIRILCVSFPSNTLTLEQAWLYLVSGSASRVPPAGAGGPLIGRTSLSASPYSLCLPLCISAFASAWQSASSWGRCAQL